LRDNLYWVHVVHAVLVAAVLQVRQAVAEFAILPLGSQVVHERLPHIKSLLLYGAPKTGKTMLAHVSVLVA
jgi:ATP-dependent 26S proteasome regulatory subunit